MVFLTTGLGLESTTFELRAQGSQRYDAPDQARSARIQVRPGSNRSSCAKTPLLTVPATVRSLPVGVVSRGRTQGLGDGGSPRCPDRRSGCRSGRHDMAVELGAIALRSAQATE